MNFFGLHHYPERGEPESLEGPEPHVWIGHKSDVNVDGTIKEETLLLIGQLLDYKNS